jgi:anthranilate synthase component 1
MKEILADTETPVTIFLKAREKGRSFLLESVEHKEEAGRYSFIGYQSSYVASMKNGELTVNGEKTGFQGNPLKVLDEKFFRNKVYRSPDYPPFLGGMVGFIAYETVRFFDNVPLNEEKEALFPEMGFFWTDSLICVDSVNQKIQIITLTYPEKEESAEHAYDKGVEKIGEIIEGLRSDFKMPDKEIEKEKGGIKLVPNMRKETFMNKVEEAKEYIRKGDAFQIVLSQRFSSQTSFSPFTIYRSLRSVNPSPYMYFLDFDEFQIMGASPEVMVKLDRDKNILIKPIAGTRPRGSSPKEDESMEKELLSDEKEKAEHIMLVDLGRNDIGRISVPGSVKVSELMRIEKYSHVMHIVSTITGKVSHPFNWVDALAATFPAGTVSGAPKIRAMQIINELEPDARGPYAGSVIYISADGVLDSCITIRTLFHRDGTLYGQAGAGIVYDSVPEKEYIETINKVRALFSAVYQLRQDSLL